MYLEKAESVTERPKCFRLKTVFKDQWYSPLKLDKKSLARQWQVQREQLRVYFPEGFKQGRIAKVCQSGLEELM